MCQSQTLFQLDMEKVAALSETERHSNELDGLRNLDPQVISSVYDRYFPDIYRFVRYRLNDDSLAEDIASDVFLRLLEATKKKRGPKKNIKAWMLSTASHIIADHLRKHYRRPVIELPEDLVDRSTTPIDEAERNHQNALTREAYQHLTPDQQTVLALRFGQGYSLEETAVAMKKKSNAIKALQFRALATLRKNIGMWHYEE
ncbi:MAG: sigma-70 family RNA polymerase sigma factor [Anaerolineae bacterium]|nr:sigma-70 family RNA polymerase sigma factor [Anaerolineae bacterium]MBT7071297.1 sigma-70 family RNA polymerase sigma factor [Anaerolineae bacterium]MBT7325921.1 sigma-70 family RNA polymerase sigma factor [Anaerolineae bacterium]